MKPDTSTNTYSPPAKAKRRFVTDTRQGAILSVLAVLALGAVVTVFFQQIYAIARGIIPPCAMLLLGLRCPLCGGTRCVGALSRMDFALAFYYNPLVVVCAAVLLYFLLRVVISCFSRPYKQYRPRTFPGEAWVLAGLYFAFFIIRNLPFYRAVFY